MTLHSRSKTVSGTAAPATAPAPSLPPLLRSELLSSLPGLVHGFSTRRGGVSTVYAVRPRRSQRAQRSLPADFGELNLGLTPEDTRDNVEENLRRFLAALASGRTPGGKVSGLRLVTLKQIHSALVWRDREGQASGDGIWTTAPGVCVGIRVADCVPILLADRRRQAVAAVHAGWRGTLARIVEKAVGELRAAGSRPDDLVAAIGPCIRKCCYSVGPEVVQAFRGRFDDAATLFGDAEGDPVRDRFPMLFLTGAPPGHPYDARWNNDIGARLDLAEANRRQLLAAGLAATAVDLLPYCTACQPELFFSYRREGTQTGRMLAAIGRLPAKTGTSRSI